MVLSAEVGNGAGVGLCCPTINLFQNSSPEVNLSVAQVTVGGATYA